MYCKKYYKIYITLQDKASFVNSKYNTRIDIAEDSNWRGEHGEVLALNALGTSPLRT